MEPKLIDYEWISHYDEIRERRVSDWSRARQCSACGRNLVHVYTVENDEGTHVLGKECAHVKLGWPAAHERRLRVLRDELIAKRRREEEVCNELLRSIAAHTYDRPGKACSACLRRNRGNAEKVIVFEHMLTGSSRRFYAVPAQCTKRIEMLERMGWVRVSI